MSNYVWPSFNANSGGFINGGGAANEVAYFSAPDTLSGDSRFRFDPTTGCFALGADAILGTSAGVSRNFDYSTTITDAVTDLIFGYYSKITYSPSGNISNTGIVGHEISFEIPSSNSHSITTFSSGGMEVYWTNSGSGNVSHGFALQAFAENRGSGAITSELGAFYFNSQSNGTGGVTGSAFKDGNFGCAGQSGSAQGTVARDYTFYAETPGHTGTMDVHCGLYMEDQEFGTQSWAIQTTGGKWQCGAPSGKDSLIYLQDSDVAHGITSIVPTDVYGAFTSISPTAGGLGLLGISDSDSIALSGFGYFGTTSPSNTTAAIQFKGGKRSGTNLQDLGATDVLFSIINNSLTSSPNLWITGGGSIYVRQQFGNARLDIASSSSDSSASSLRVTDSGDGSAMFIVRNDKRTGFGTSTLNSTGEFLSKTASSGITKIATFTGAAHTGITSTTEANWFDVAPNQTHTWTAGDVTTQRAAVFRAETIAASGASIFTNAATLALTGAPTAGSNVIITNPFAFWVQSGSSRFDGLIDVSGIAASSAALKAVATSDTPSVAFTGGGNAPNFAPAGYLKINVGGNSRYIPFWS